VLGKPALPREKIARLLSEQLLQDVELEGIHEGLESQGFTLLLGGVESLVRIDYSLHGFEKDRYAAESFSSEGGILHYSARNGSPPSLVWTQDRVQGLIEESLTP
jgi:hypothetical protein